MASFRKRNDGDETKPAPPALPAPGATQPTGDASFIHRMPANAGVRRASRRPSLLDGANRKSAGALLARRTFQMYVLPIAELLQLQRLPYHEDIVDKLVVWEEGMAPVVFVSQTWLSDTHPDNEDNVKLTLLKDVLRKARDGELSISTQWVAAIAYGRDLSISADQLQHDLKEGYVWFDVMSVPQRSKEGQERAIASIMSYVADASYFMVLAGSWVHTKSKSVRDFSGWMGRGWCRVEQLANALGTQPKPVIAITSETSIVTYGPGGVVCHTWLQNVVGLGAFSVESDRVALGPVINECINRRLTHALEHEDMVTYRVLRCAAPKLLEGTGMVLDEQRASLDDWLANLGYSTANDGEDNGLLTPLMCAVMAKRVDFVRELLVRGAKVDAPLVKAHPEFSLAPAVTALHVAGIFGDEASAQVLLNAGADVQWHDATPSKVLPFNRAAAVGASFTGIFDAHPEFLLLRDGLGQTPINLAAITGHATALRQLLQRYPLAAAPLLRGETSTGRTILSDCFIDTWNEDCARACIEAGCDVNLVGKPDMPKIKALYAICDAVCAVSKCLGKRASALPHRMAFCSRCTPLHYAAYFGNHGGVELLVAHGADISSTNHPCQMTPAQLAEMQGHSNVAKKLRSLDLHQC